MKTGLALFLLVATPMQSAAARPDSVQALLGVAGDVSAPGCALGVFRNGRLAEFRTSGAADVATGRAMNADTQFYAASVSKQFTTLAAMQLVAQGKLDLDADIRKWLPELPDYGHRITLRMLMNHTAGIRDSLELLAFSGKSDIAAATRAEALAVTLAQTATKFEPGTRYDYSNGGYLLLSEIVERVSGEPFETYVNRHVLKPIGMTRSFVMQGSRSADANIARGYARPGETADSYPLFGGSGGLITTLNDLAKYDRDIDSGHKVWTPAIRKLMLEPGRFNDGTLVKPAERAHQAYASGVIVGPDWFWHTGGARGFKTMFAHNSKSRVGLGLLCNNGEIVPQKLLNQIVLAMPGRLPPLLAAEPVLADGRYRSPDLAVVYELSRAGDTLKLAILPAGGGAPLDTVTLIPKDNGYAGGGMRLLPDADGGGFEVIGGRVALRFRKV